MRRIILLSSLIATVSLLADETPTPPSIEAFTRGTPFDAGDQPTIRLWGDADYLYWWTKKYSLPVAIATKGSAGDAVPAALGQPGTKVLFGKDEIHPGALSGFRLSLRSWFGEENNYAVEGSGFYLPEKRETVFSKESSKVLGVPFDNVAPFPLPSNAGGWSGLNAGETALLLGSPSAPRVGEVTATSSTQLWGVELNGLFHFFSLPHFRLSALGGVAYCDLSERLDIRFESVATDSHAFRHVIIKDHFWTHNEIYTAQMGLRGEWSNHWLFTTFLAKLGIGGAREIAHIHGSFSDPVPDLYRDYGAGNSGGIFTQPTNHGEHVKGHFEVIPSATLRVGLNLLRDLRLSVGYDVLYISSVLRPGEKIDRRINETQAGPGPNGTKPVLTGPARPKARMHTTTYWAQGINVGIAARF